MLLTERSEYTPTVVYGSPDPGTLQVWYRVCSKCGRFVKADKYTRIPEYQREEPNATCKKCGRVRMDFCGWMEDEEELKCY